MPGVVTIRQPLTILSLTGFSSPPTTEEHNQKLPFTLGKCPVSSTNQSSPIKEERKHADNHAQQSFNLKMQKWKKRNIQDSPWKQTFPSAFMGQRRINRSWHSQTLFLLLVSYPVSCQVKSTQWCVLHPSQFLCLYYLFPSSIKCMRTFGALCTNSNYKCFLLIIWPPASCLTSLSPGCLPIKRGDQYLMQSVIVKINESALQMLGAATYKILNKYLLGWWKRSG